MIISASRRTDIPALYSSWFLNRLHAGWCAVPNPFNQKQVSRVSLRPEDVDGIVFWTRNPKPLMPGLPALDRRDYRYYFQYTITGYGPPVEPRSPSLDATCRVFRDLAARLRPGSVVWRYDPILVGNAFPSSVHIERFRNIAAQLEGSTSRVVVSVLDVYKKTERRLGKILRWGEDLATEPMSWHELDDLLARLARIARDHGMTPEACAEERDLSDLGIGRTKCVDDRLFASLFGGVWSERKDPGQRSACGCVPSRDIGMPDTCTLGCAYCYATASDDTARRRHGEHDPESASLWGSFEPPCSAARRIAQGGHRSTM